MKKFTAVLIAALTAFSVPTMAAETAKYSFEDESVKTLTNTAAAGGNALYSENGYFGRALELDGSYGIDLGYVTNNFSVSAMVKLTSVGNNDTIFFKNMGDTRFQKWTGVLSRGCKLALWSNGSDGLNKTTLYEAKEAALNEWAHVVYTENAGVGKLYVNGIFAGKGNVANGAGELYLGTTLWENDAPSGFADEVRVYDRALSYEEIFNLYYGEYSLAPLGVPAIASEAVEDIELITSLGIKDVAWETSDAAVITAEGKVTRANEDKTVTLKAYIDGEMTNEFVVSVPKKAATVNKDVLLSYRFDGSDGAVIHDVSGNGNHATAYNKLKMGEDGAYFDGIDDYVKLPEGVLGGRNAVTIVFDAKPEKEQEHIFAYVFGNSSQDGYMFLNTNRPGSKELRFAATPTGSGQEKAVWYVPGISKDQWGKTVVVINGTRAELYLDGKLLMSGDIGISVSQLGNTACNYIAKSLYEADGYFKGTVREFTVYGRAMTAAEVMALSE